MFFPLIFLGVGLILFAVGAYQIDHGLESRKWPTVHGVITLSELGKHTDRDMAHDTISTIYSADISYGYLVDDRRYVSGSVHFGSMSSSDPSVARAMLQRYPVGKAVTVFYNPDRPRQAVLEPGVPGVVWVLPALGVLFAVVGSGFTWLVLRLLESQDSVFTPGSSAKLNATSAATSTS